VKSKNLLWYLYQGIFGKDKWEWEGKNCLVKNLNALPSHQNTLAFGKLESGNPLSG